MDRSKEGYDKAIKNVAELGQNASRNDVEMAQKAAKQAGQQGRAARDALDKRG